MITDPFHSTYTGPQNRSESVSMVYHCTCLFIPESMSLLSVNEFDCELLGDI